MRVALWHGWLLESSGSNVYTANVARAMRSAGHDVLLVCQEPAPEAMDFVDGWGTVSADGVSEVRPTGVAPAPGRVVLLRPVIGTLLPVFVLDEYPGFDVKRFVDLTDAELSAYLRMNADAFRVAVEWHGSEAVIAGHAIPGPVVASMALGPGRYAAKVHGSDLEYAVRADARYRDLARDGLMGAVAVTASGSSLMQRTAEVVPEVADRLVAAPPGVDADRFMPRPGRDALLDAAGRLEADPETARGRPVAADADVERALVDRDGDALARLPATYDHSVPDPAAAEVLRALAGARAPLVGYLGKLIPQKGVHLYLQALRMLPAAAASGVVVGFGSFREWLAALELALDRGDPDAAEWLAEAAPMETELAREALAGAAGRGRVPFTGQLDHRYAPEVLSALTVLVVPSILIEAFGMVAVEAAAAGALPLVARHSGLEEIAREIEEAVGRPGLLSFDPGPGAADAIARGLRRILEIPLVERDQLRLAVSDAARGRWTWDRTAGILIDAASRRPA